MHQYVEGVPAFAEVAKGGIDLLIELDVAGERDVGVELRGQLLDAGLEALVLVRESQLRSLAVQRLRNAPGDRTVACDANDQSPFAFEKTHRASP